MNHPAQTGAALVLTDSHALSFWQTGQGKPQRVLYCHGYPGSRLELDHVQQLSDTLNWHIVVPDRPGYGHSSPAQYTSFKNWAEDVAALADHLGWDRFHVMGFCGSTPFAAACAHYLGDRVESLGLIGPQGPLSDPEVLGFLPAASRQFFDLALASIEGFAQLVEPLTQQADQLSHVLIDGFAPIDQALLTQTEAAEYYRANNREATRQQAAGILHDIALLTSDWGFELSDVSCPVLMWHGDQDEICTQTMLSWVHSQLPHASVHSLGQIGHFALYPHWPRFMRDMEGLQ